MALKDLLPSVDYYTQFDPYTYVVDNRPLINLHDRDELLANSIDNLGVLVDVTGGVTPVVNASPVGWVISRTAVGDYTVTHNKNSLNYSIVLGVVSATPLVIYTYAKTLNSFSVKISSLTNVLTDAQFSCIISSF